MNTPRETRTDTATRLIAASPQTLYRAFIDPAALAKWLPPTGMTARIDRFELQVGGSYQMILTYDDPSATGKASDNCDVVEGKFIALVPDERVVQQVEFESEDPAFAGVMTMTWALKPASGRTEVTFLCEGVPPGISKEDHDAGLRSTLENLAAFTEG